MTEVKTIELNRPLDNVTIVEIREPKAGELRGLKMADIIQLDVTAMATLLPRISNLSARDMENLSTADLTKLFTETLSFFVDSSQAE
ncbi:MAG: phage tail assembly protein [Thiotrichales bacterium]|jgi:hypothetical protein|nr:phage tail assembly protein [Thiotrichales bacterium]